MLLGGVSVLGAGASRGNAGFFSPKERESEGSPPSLNILGIVQSPVEELSVGVVVVVEGRGVGVLSVGVSHPLVISGQ